MLAADFVALAALDGGIVKVGVVELNLHDLDLRVLGQDLFENLRPVVERNAEVADLALFFELQHRLICAALLEILENFGILRVHQIEVEVVHAADFQLALKKWPDVLLLFKIRHRQLVCQNVGLARIAARQAGLDGLFAFALQIAVGGVKIVKARVQKRIYHFTGLLQIDLFSLHGKAHVTEAKVPFDFLHSILLSRKPESVFILRDSLRRRAARQGLFSLRRWLPDARP